MSTEKNSKLAVFEGKRIRKIFHEGEWWFSIIDVIDILVGGDRPRKYWNDLKKKLIAEGYGEVSEKIGQLKMFAPDGKQRLTDCANIETMFRIVWNVHSHSGELPFKPERPLTLAEQGRLILERAKRNAAYESKRLGEVFDAMGITRDPTITREKVQQMYLEAGFDPEATDFAQGIVAMRDE